MGRSPDREISAIAALEGLPLLFAPAPPAGLLAEPLALDEEGLQELERLCTALASLRGQPALFLAFCDSPLLRDRLIAEVAARLPEWSMRVFRVPETAPDFLPRLVAEETIAGDAVFVIVDSQAITSVARYLNYRREILARLPYPVVLWFPHSAEAEIHRLAPDFWAFRRQAFTFRLFAPWLLGVSQKVAEAGVPAGTSEERQAAISLLRQLLRDLQETGAGNTMLAARLHRELGGLLRQEHFWEESRRELEQALAIAGCRSQIADSKDECAHTYYSLGLTLYYLDEYDAALESYRAALGLFRAVGDRLGEANTLQAIGDVQRFRDEYDAALESYRAALGLYRAVGSRLGEANTLAARSRLALRQGRDEEARALLQQAVDLHTAIGSRYDVAVDLGNFGLALRDLGRIEEARPYLLQAAEIFDGIALPQQAEQMRQAAVAQD